MPRDEQEPLEQLETVCPFSMMRDDVRLCLRDKCELYIQKGAMCCFRALNQISYNLRMRKGG